MSITKIKYGFIPVVVVIGLLLLAKAGMLPFSHAKSVLPVASSVTISASEVQYMNITPKLLLTGSIEGETTGIISAKIGGRIAEVLVEDGQRVSVGQALVRLDNVELSNAVAIASDSVRRQQASYENSATDYRRYQALYEEKAISKQQLDSAETKLRIAETDLSTANASLSNAKEQYQYGVVTAPVSGVVANKSAVIGQVVSAGLPLMTVEKIGQVYAVVNVEQKDMGLIKAGMPTEVTVDAYPGEVFSGVVDIINPVAATTNRMFRVKVKLGNEDSRLKPGMFVKTSIQMGVEKKALFVPQSAVFQKQGIYYVYVIQNDKVVKQKIEIGIVKDDFIEVKTGVQDKVQVANSNINTLKDGDAIQVTK